jgi:hypothetical protein
MTAVALFCACIGLGLLVAPQEAAQWLGERAGGSVLTQLLGAAFLGFGGLNWVARRSVIGGIYGRAVVVCNQVHFSVGALLLGRQTVGGGVHAAPYWIAITLYVFGAALFNWLLFGSSGVQAERGRPTSAC